VAKGRWSNCIDHVHIFCVEVRLNVLIFRCKEADYQRKQILAAFAKPLGEHFSPSFASNPFNPGP